MKRLILLLVLSLPAASALAQHGDVAASEPITAIFAAADAREVAIESEHVAMTLVVPRGHFLRVEAAGTETSSEEAQRGLFRGDLVLSTLPAECVEEERPLEEAFAAATNRLELRDARVRVVQKEQLANAPTEPFLR